MIATSPISDEFTPYFGDTGTRLGTEREQANFVSLSLSLNLSSNFISREVDEEACSEPRRG